ncbi:MAG: DUF6265 family protein [Xanthomonadales bacterium]|nr:DUF6265 family protein [Xanthomonadales bacterium]
MYLRTIAGALALIVGSAVTGAAELRTEHTYGLSEGEARPQATLEDAAFLAGSWTGTAFGKQFETVWNPPSQGSMVGLFKLFDDQGVSFYEILLLTVDEEGALSLKVKHFTPDFIAWEEKEDFINFRLVKLSEDELHFSGLSFYRRGDDRMDGYIVMRNGDQLSEQHLVYRRR